MTFRIVSLFSLTCLLLQAPTLEAQQFQQAQPFQQVHSFLQAQPMQQVQQPVQPMNWAQIPIHKHAYVQAEMMQNGPGYIWRSRIKRPKSHGSVDVMDTRNFTLFDYRKMFTEGRTPAPAELIGRWRGVNKGIVELVGYRQFIKDIVATPCDIRGDNILVHQVSNDMLRSIGWAPKPGMPEEGYVSRVAKFAIEAPQGVGPFKHGAVFSYKNGENELKDPVRILVDKVVVLDRNHLLGRVTANFGLVRIPLAYFTLERIE